jgi:ABC-type uncharacterized transport system YnjBCD ATPase subunit
MPLGQVDEAGKLSGKDQHFGAVSSASDESLLVAPRRFVLHRPFSDTSVALRTFRDRGLVT